MTAPEPTPLACVPGAIPAAERPAHLARARRLFTVAARARERLPEGYAFRFGPEELMEVARFVESERRCCPFLAFEVAVAPGDTGVWLRMTGPAGTRALLETELPIPEGAR